MKQIFTFWEGNKPAYIDLCMQTWKIPYTVVNYSNIKDYIDISDEVLNKLKSKYSLPIIADFMRVHLLEKHGGYWIDADTIMCNDKFPECNMLGYPKERGNHIGYLNTEPHSEMFVKWKEFQDKQLQTTNNNWNVMGNAFTDLYVKNNLNIIIGDVHNYTPEVYMMSSGERYNKYQDFYFNKDYHLSDLEPAEFFMLHNSWTPQWYKNLSKEDVLKQKCTLTNIIKECI